MTDQPAKAPTGLYHADPSHSSVHFRIKHLALSWYTGRFGTLSAELDFDADNPEAMAVRADVDLRSLAMFYAKDDKDWDKELAEGEQFLDATKNPHARFVSTKVMRTSEDTADVTGDLSFRGGTHPFTFKAVFNGAMLDHPLGAKMIGFSANGVLKRSDYGLTFGLSPRMPDEVQIIVEAEFAMQGETK